MGLAVEGWGRNLAEDQIEGSATLTLSDSAAGRPSGTPATFVPVILTSSGRNNSFFTSELTLTNRGDQPATLNYTYTAHIGGGSGTASETLAAGRQKIVPDAIDHLRDLGTPIPNAGNRIGTLRVAISGSSQVGVMVRTTTRVADGRAGLAFPGVAAGFEEAVYLCGLRQNRQDRSNVAFQNMGTEGEITLRTTVYSGEAGDSSFRVLEAVTLAPGGFHQYSGLLATAGFTQGYVKVERIEGTAPFYAYGIINDQGNSDGAFVFPVTASALRGTRGQTLPVIVETGVFSSELIVTNFSEEAKRVTFRFRAEAIQTPDKTASLEWTFHPGQQMIVPNVVEMMRQMGLPGIGPPGSTFAGALAATVARGNMSGIVIGARTGTSGGGGQYSVFYNAVPYGDAFIEAAWEDALQQNEENRSNLALVNTAEVDSSPSVFSLEIYDGETGMLANNLQSLDLGFNPDLTGTIPTELQQLPLSTLELMATAVCVPEDVAFQDWLATIDSFLSSGLVCGRPPDPMPSIDVAVFFTPAARRQAGGNAEIEALIDLMVVETNQAYEDSGANQRIVLAAREEVPYEEENESGFLALRRLGDKSDGYMDEVHTIRDRTGADLVHLIADVTDVGGIANVPGAFGVTCADCPSMVFAHELGHNMGLSHDRYVARGLLPYSYGYLNQQAFAEDAPESARWRTIMTYDNQCGDAGFSCGWILRFSNPNQTYLGDPLGVPGEERTAVVDGPADAARTLNLTRHSVASFRPQAPENRQMLSSTLSPARSVLRTGQAPAPLPGGGLFRPLALNPAPAALQRDGRGFDPATLRRRQVSVDTGRLARVPDSGPTALTLNLFDDLIVTGIIQRRTPTYSGGYALSGRLAAVPGGTVTLVVNGSMVAGTVRLPGATYRIRPTGRGSHSIVQIDPSQSSWHCGTEPRPH